MKYKNYYKVLELHNERVTDDDIKLAYRKLAKYYHPDINPGNELAAEKFKDINEAYQVLGSETNRKKYDRLHFAYKLKGNFSLKKLKTSINKEGINEFLNMFLGKQNITKDTYEKDKKKAEDIIISINVTLEETFFGAEKKIAFKDTNGNLKTIIMNIPKGIKSGEKIRLAGQGKRGLDGIENGDMYIIINILEHKRFKLEGLNLIMDLPVTPWEAALGTELDIQGIDSNISVTIPKGIQSGDKLRISNYGYCKGDKRGDLLINVKIMIPKELTEEEKELFKKFNDISNFHPRIR